MAERAPSPAGGPYRTSAREAPPVRRRPLRRAAGVRAVEAPRDVGLAASVAVGLTFGGLNGVAQQRGAELAPMFACVETVFAAALVANIPAVGALLVRAWRALPAPRATKRRLVAKSLRAHAAVVALALAATFGLRPSASPVIARADAPDGRVAYALALLDTGKLRAAVVEFYSRDSLKPLTEALGEPTEIARELVKLLGEEEPGLDIAGIEQELRKVHSPNPPSAQVLAEEVELARQELTRYWVDLLGIAWRGWATNGELRLDKNLLPEIDAPKWVQLRKAALEGLLDSVALTSDGASDVTRAVVDAVKGAVERDGRLELLDGLAIVKRGASLCVVASGRAPAAKDRTPLPR